jgi:hypothetical protein
MRGLLKRPVVVVGLAALFGVATWQTGSVLAVMGLLTLAYMGWDLAKGGSLSRVITMPAAAWAAGFGFYTPLAAGAPVSVALGQALMYVTGALYAVWAIPVAVRHGLTGETFVKLAVGAVIVIVVLAGLSSLVPGV